MSKRHGHGWNSPRGDSAVRTTAYILARLGEVPREGLNHATRQQIEASLDWLVERQTPGGGWHVSPGRTPDDAATTSWAVVALRQHGKQASDAALEFIRQCQQPDGAFASHPAGDGSEINSKSNYPEITAVAIRALGYDACSSAKYLELVLRAMGERTSRLAPGLSVCANVLDWEAGVAPLFLVREIRQFIHNYIVDGALEQALLLRCLARLRMQRSWSAAATLRRLQHPDGSWPGTPSPAGLPLALQDQPVPGDDNVLSTVTALSALAVAELQPGLYFGSDLPFRRLDES